MGDTRIEEQHSLTCHCGAVELLINLPDGIIDPRRCDCSICRRKGAVVASAKLDQIEVIKGSDQLRLYQFNTGACSYYFCSNCGVYTHHQRRSHPDEYGYNVGCLEGVNPFLIDGVAVDDGVNHPSDQKNSV